MDLLKEVQQEVERDKLKAFFMNNYKTITLAVLLLVSAFIASLLYKNYKTKQITNSYIEFIENSKNNFESEINSQQPNAIETIHFINKYSYLSKSGDKTAAQDLLNSLNYKNVDYQPFRELLYLYDHNIDGELNNNDSKIFNKEAIFIKILNEIQNGNLAIAEQNLQDFISEPTISEALRNKSQELLKIVRFNLNENI
ncbi:MAG: hypothetical protein ISQ32_01460 [Rickettsiales bacterium]|nr:hypothetical protein [Rickettsiales bacterium]